MPAAISERAASREFTVGQQNQRELQFLIRDAADEAEAQTILEATAPIVYAGLVRESISANHLGGDIWEGVARYTRLADQPEFTFDTGGGTAHITQGLGTVASYAPPGQTAPDFQGAIGVNGDSIEGTDIVVPVYQFTETHYFEDGFVTPAYKATLFALTGRTNNALFKGFQIGEVLSMGVSGSKRGDEKWGLTFRYAASPNLSGLIVGAITGIAKRGWEYLWVRYQDVDDGFAYQLVKRPTSVHIEQVYYPGDFSGFGIGV